MILIIIIIIIIRRRRRIIIIRRRRVIRGRSNTGRRTRLLTISIISIIRGMRRKQIRDWEG